MQMIRAVIRPEMESKVVECLEKEGCISLTKMEVFGRGKQKGIHIADIHYDELQKTMLLMVVEDEHKDKVIKTITEAARTGKYGDGRIFVNPVEEAYTIRTGKTGL
ncbi:MULTISPECIES: P-II family nitrogen regulator [unclassified Methanosarcina]|uniref:P-II family nitrogen regulator n=1 Tax=unclassified Methanosarcina TaxID=2644672 RepID=UPI000615D197|nr:MULTISPECIES: P-II family nitrogen regulator [unclassified Methanosarcina]AKB17679.1 Nitrogen regulatory protein P-II [Methanosarcina sp. WWM596]AKB21035.1 Nitrogen regulatory protein P-II [Methanosarcina sp. WH1]